MIRSIFIPDSIGSYYLLRKRVVGITVTQRAVHASLVVLRGRTRTIEAVFEEPLSLDKELAPDQKIVAALQSVRSKLPKFDAVHYALPSSQVIFKELTLPFTGLKKIKMVVPFEAEPLLPFSLDQGVIDSIVTHENSQEQTTDIFIAAVKNEVLEEVVEYCAQAELPLDKISVDIFDLYGLFNSLSFASNKKTTALILMGADQTTLGLIDDGRLIYIRNFHQGCNSSDTKSPTLDTATKERLNKLLDDIRLTIEVTLSKISPESSLEHVILSGMITDLKGSKEFVAKALGAPVDRMTPKLLITSGVVTSSLTNIPGTALVSIATATSPEKTEEFTLLQEYEQEKLSQRVLYQLAAVALISLTMFLSFSVYSFLRVRTLKRAYKSAEREAIKELQKQFKLRPGRTSRLDIANKAAQIDLKKQETAWRRISPESRYAYLKYLAELTKCIDRKKSQLELTSLIIKDDTIKLYGSVPGYPQLNKLQIQLECPLFKRVPKLQDKNFKTEPILLIVNEEML